MTIGDVSNEGTVNINKVCKAKLLQGQKAKLLQGQIVLATISAYFKF